MPFGKMKNTYVSGQTGNDNVGAFLHAADGTAITQTAGALDVNIASGTLTTSDAALADTAIKSTQKDVTDTSGLLLVSALASRKYFIFQNLSTSKDVFIGASGVVVGDGISISKGGGLAELRMGPSIALHAVAVDSGPHDTRILELS